MEIPETGLFTTVTTDVPGVDACVLYVPEKLFKSDTNTSEGIALKDFMVSEGANKEDALDRDYGDYVLTGPGPQVNGMRAYWFAKERTPEEIAVPFRSLEGEQLGIPWPPVVNGIAVANVLEYTSDGTSYVAGAATQVTYSRPGYDGVTQVIEEWFASHVPFTPAKSATLQPMGGVFDYGVGTFTLPVSLHGEIPLTWTTGTDNPRYPNMTFEWTFAATIPTNWPAEWIRGIDQTFERGLYIMRRLKALKPF